MMMTQHQPSSVALSGRRRTATTTTTTASGTATVRVWVTFVVGVSSLLLLLFTGTTTDAFVVGPNHLVLPNYYRATTSEASSSSLPTTRRRQRRRLLVFEQPPGKDQEHETDEADLLQDKVTTASSDSESSNSGEDDSQQREGILTTATDSSSSSRIAFDSTTGEGRELFRDEEYMRQAIQMAQSAGGERGELSAYPNPTVGAVLASAADGRVIGKGRSDYRRGAVLACLEDAGLEITALEEWCVQWPSDSRLRSDLAESTLYLTMEPAARRRGTAEPAETKLIAAVEIPRVVIGCAHPVADCAAAAAQALHAAGTAVSLGNVLAEECRAAHKAYADLANSKLQRMARKHFELFGRPLGFLHCSVVDSDDIEAFARRGNAFGTDFGGKKLGYRNFGSYEIAPPPEVVWAKDEDEDDDDDYDDDDDDDDETELQGLFSVDFDEEDYQGDINTNNPMMPWYEQADAVVATFPKPGNGPADDDSLTNRLSGLKWLATHGDALPAGVERILVMDATDLADLPLTNDNPHWGGGSGGGGGGDHHHGSNKKHHHHQDFVDVEAFWRGENRKPTRVLLRRGMHAAARAAAQSAAAAARAAAAAAEAAVAATESGDAERAAEEALKFQKEAERETAKIRDALREAQDLKTALQERGAVVETLAGTEPIDVMKHLGERNGLRSVVWRAGCWGERGVRSILAGAFQWVSAHLAVDAVGGKFWQLMLAENAVQAACGPERKVKVFADQEDISLEYCDRADADEDCTLTLDGRPVRHIRLDCRVALVDENRPREFNILPTRKMDRQVIEEEAPWFL